jgi:MIP family channel proteins
MRDGSAETHSRGLHGHALGANLVRVSAAEAVGTFLLVLTIVSTVIAAGLGRSVVGSPYGSLAVPLAGGIALAAIVAGFGPISGAHLNPAVTIGLATNKRFPWKHVLAYVASQLAGAFCAALAAWAIFGSQARSSTYLGATYPAKGVDAGRVLGTEAVVTFFLVLVVVSVATNPRVPATVAAVAIGLALAGAILIAGPVTGGAVNPARALGPMIAAGRFTDWWSYVLGSLVGGAVAVTFYDKVLRPVVPPIK